MIDGHLMVGYHGCDVTVRDGLVSGRLQPEESNNQYDWLGPGFYMFEGDEERARSFAESASFQPERRLTARPIATPAVVGCLFSVQRCLDMTTRAGRLEFEDAYLLLQGAFLQSGRTPPINVPAHKQDQEVLLRGLDRSVFDFIHTRRDELQTRGTLQAVRGAFRQGVEIAPSSGFHRDSHVQIALRDFSCIRGWFLLPGDRQLKEIELAAATERYAQACAAHPKPRRRSP
ncbi:hypothetical protein [Stenotrophomonas sp. PS02289]|uniref:hypothetical protein n=1 Tax=Stenotrophomonas sp. PS02289 TaxID=2991422 RepID=UPI00249C5188|nr:hypothetical protein [Stenotrophomonas sp. PS02289]